MTTNFTHNPSLVDALSSAHHAVTDLVLKITAGVSTACPAILLILCSIGNGDTTVHTYSFIYTILAVILLLAANYMFNQGKRKAGGILSGITIGLSFALHTIVRMKHEEHFFTLTNLFLIAGILGLVLSMTLPLLFASKNRIAIANAKQSYLELTPTHIQGMEFSDMYAAGCGRFFEIPYDDCRHVQMLSADNGEEPLYNFAIHHKGGTCRIAINNPGLALQNIDTLCRYHNDIDPKALLAMSDNAVVCSSCHEIQNGGARCKNCGEVLDKS